MSRKWQVVFVAGVLSLLFMLAYVAVVWNATFPE